MLRERTEPERRMVDDLVGRSRARSRRRTPVRLD